MAVEEKENHVIVDVEQGDHEGAAARRAKRLMSGLLSEIEGAWSGLDLFGRDDRKKPTSGLKGVFFGARRNDEVSVVSPVAPVTGSSSSQNLGGDGLGNVRGRSGDFMTRLRLMLSSEEATAGVSSQLYQRFEGSPQKLEKLLETIEDRWGFPERVFPLLQNQLSKVQQRQHSGLLGQHGVVGERPIGEEDWSKAFKLWLQQVHRKCSDIKVSRQCFVQTRTGQDLWKEYLEGIVLGKGSYGEVRTALHAALGVARVVKSVPKAQLGLAEDQVEDEVDTLKSLDHPHIVRVFEAFEDQDTLHIVMDYAEGGDLASVIRNMQAWNQQLPERWACLATRQVASALEYMHSQGVIHCDLKPGNTMLLKKLSSDTAESDEPHVLLADFGLAQIFDGEPPAGGKPAVKGTPAYLAPEGFEGRMTYKTDMWALGVMIFEVLTLERPFKGTNNVFMLFCQVANTDPSLDGLPLLAKEVVRLLMSKDPEQRPSAGECKALAWFQETAQKTLVLSEQLGDKLGGTLGHASYFTRAVMFCMAAGLGASNAPGQDMEGIFSVFQAMDMDNSGQLSMEELKAGLKQMGIHQQASALMHVVDMNQDDSISYTEFLAAALRVKGELSDRLCRYAFSMIDVDGDGQISKTELRRLLAGGSYSVSLDVLPDGKTLDEVMEEVSGGNSESISFQSFADYLYREGEQAPLVAPRLPSRKDLLLKSSTQQTLTSSGGTTAKETLKDLVKDLDFQTDLPPQEEVDFWSGTFIPFHAWLDGLFEDTELGAEFGRMLIFANRDAERAYVGHYMRTTCIQMGFMTSVMVCYAIWNLCVSGFRWDPSVAAWDHPVRVAYNVAWFVIAFSGVAVISACVRWILKEKSQRSMPPSDRNEMAFEIDSMRLETGLCVWGCLLPWVSCCFANRFRVASLFGYESQDVFSSMNSDYDLIILIIAVVVFLSTRTHIRFFCSTLIGVSSCLAYICTSVVLGVADPRCDDAKYSSNLAWPGVLLVVVCTLSLCGHHSVEYHRRLAFLSLYASYGVLKDAQEDDPNLCQALNSSKDPGATSTAKIQRALSLVKRFAHSAEVFSKPIRSAIGEMIAALQETQQEVVKADRLHITDVSEVLDQINVAGGAREKLLMLFNALPTDGDQTPANAKVRLRIASNTHNSKQEPWGWDIRHSAASSSGGARRAKEDRLEECRPLLDAAERLLLPAAIEAASEAKAPLAERCAREMVSQLLECYGHAQPGAEARAALAVHAAHWLAQQMGLWPLLQPWERLGLLVAASGLHSGAAGPAGAAGGILATEDPLLRQAASLAHTLAALDGCKLSETLSDGESAKLRQLVRRLLARLQPIVILEDALRLNCALELEDAVLTQSEVECMASMGLVLAGADLAFLALPRTLYSSWRDLCQQEAAAGLDVAGYLRGLAHSLALPVFKSLGLVDGKQAKSSVPLQNLEANLLRWGNAELIGTHDEPTAADSHLRIGSGLDGEDVMPIFPLPGSSPQADDMEPSTTLRLERVGERGELGEPPAQSSSVSGDEPATLLLHELGPPPQVQQLPGSVNSPTPREM